MLQAPKQQLAAGDRAPNFVLPDHKGTFTMFYDRVQGRPVVLLIAGAFQPPILPAPLLAFEAAAEKFDAQGVDLFCISRVAPEVVRALATKMHSWSDPERKISDAYLNQLGMNGDALKDGNVVCLLLDANQRALAVKTGKTADLAEDALKFYAALGAPAAPQARRASAPVLVMPDLLDPDMCQQLIRMTETGDIKEGVVGSVLAGKETERVLHERKKRLDMKIEDPALHQILHNVIGRRVAPELGKAFNFQGFTFDRFVLCRYAADRGDRFRTHRDNVSPETADRRFAMTLNLNGDEYEGGELVFPEYGPDRYKPGNGGAVIFGCSLLHEALPVTKGVRFALLTFLRAPSAPGGPARR